MKKKVVAAPITGIWDDSWMQLPDGTRIKKTMVLWYGRRASSLTTTYRFKEDPNLYMTQMSPEDFDKEMGRVYSK